MSKQLRDHLLSLLAKNARLDDRGLLDYRKPIKIEYDISKSAEGSAQVTIGETVVMVGVKLALEKPYPDTPDQGCFMVGAELLPLSSPNFESGPPSIQAIELARVVDRGIRESKAIDMKKMCIREGELTWSVLVDIISINDAGNLFDASALAVLAALKVTKFPKMEDDKIDYKELTDKKLPMAKIPISVTVCKIGDHYLVDPISDEESVIDSRLTVASLEDGTLCAMQKGGAEVLTLEEVDKMVSIALDKAKDLRKVLG